MHQIYDLHIAEDIFVILLLTHYMTLLRWLVDFGTNSMFSAHINCVYITHCAQQLYFPIFQKYLSTFYFLSFIPFLFFSFSLFLNKQITENSSTNLNYTVQIFILFLFYFLYFIFTLQLFIYPIEKK